MHFHRRFSTRLAFAVVGLTLGSLTFGCTPAVVAPPTPIPDDPFVVVRATSQAAYASGKAHLDRGELQQALVDLDTAKTNDPDTRADIELALSQTISQLALQTPTPEPTTVARPIVIATLAAIRPASPGTPGAPAPRPTSAIGGALAPGITGPADPSAGAAAPTSEAAAGPAAAAGATTTSANAGTAPTSATASTSSPAAASKPAASPQPGGSTTLVAWRDPQGRFTLSAPANWARSSEPLSLFGTSVVQFNDPGVQAELDVAVDSGSKAVSPELYAATMELAMQRQVPGYAAEQTLPGSTAGNPSVRRVYTFTQRDAAGNDTQARGFQVAVVKGSTPYLISGSAPADQFEAFNATFEQMLDTFRFS